MNSEHLRAANDAGGLAKPMGRLDASWRSEYITAATAAERDSSNPNAASPEGCVFCRILNSENSDDGKLIVFRGQHTFVILNAYPYTSGHLMCLPYRHVAVLDELTTEEHLEMWSCVTRATSTLTRAYQPEGMNVGANLGRAAGAGVPGHLHVHVVPRWNGDTNFMTAIAEVRVVPEALDVTLRRVRSSWL
jgi:ATP adenylyltransferase